MTRDENPLVELQRRVPDGWFVKHVDRDYGWTEIWVERYEPGVDPGKIDPQTFYRPNPNGGLRIRANTATIGDNLQHLATLLNSIVITEPGTTIDFWARKPSRV